MTPASNHPPLHVWWYTAAIIAILMVLLAFEDRIPAFARHATAASSEILNLGRLSDTTSRPLRIVALGSSKTLYAIDYDNRFIERLAALPQPVVFNRVTWQGANFWDLEPALRVLVTHPPDVLLLESDLLLFDRGGRFPIRRNLLPLEQWFHGYLAGRDDENENHGQNRGAVHFASAQECAARQSEAQRLVYAMRLSTARFSTPASRRGYLEFLRSLQRSGTHIVLMSLPRAPWAEAAVPPWAAQIEAVVLPQLARENRFGLWAPNSMPPAAFCDQGHMTSLGRDLYSSWLAAKLLAMRSAGHE